MLYLDDSEIVRNLYKHSLMKSILMPYVAVVLFFIVGCENSKREADEVKRDYIQYVDPLIGSGYHGHVFVGANLPFGAVQLGVTNVTDGWDWCSGYHISDSTIVGYAHTHLSGTGIGDKGDILFMPYVGKLSGYNRRDYLTTYKPENQTARAGYYSVVDERYGVKTELTATTRVGFHKYPYPKDEMPKLLINLKQGIGWDRAVESVVEQRGSKRIEGYRLSKGWAEDDRVYFVAEFSKNIKEFLWIDSSMVACITFEDGVNLEAAVAISGVNIEGASKNFDAEARGVSFGTASAKAQKEWNNFLSRIDIQSDDLARLRTFYTSLYHSAFYPSIFNDVDGKYRGANGEIYSSNEDIYTQFSLWDTYRAAHPLYTLIVPERVPSMINSMLNIYDQQGKLPIWHLSGNETNCMTGVSSVQVVGDAIMKGFEGIDYERAYAAMAAYAELDERGLKEIRELGFYPADSDVESVARALEYCISDAAVARVAEKLGKNSDAAKFKERSKGYKRYFDKSDNFMKGVLSNGMFRKPFDPAYSTHRGDDFCEGNSWQYTWMVPHDYQGLFELMGGVEEAERRLDLTYATPYVPSKDASPDISGMMGQVAHGNEPSHATPYAYAAMGRADKTARTVRHIMDSLYFDKPEGISGNEDMGQMSAWYILNAMGFYQPDPSSAQFVFGSPLFEEVTLMLPNKKVLKIICENYDSQNIYIESATINDKPLSGEISYSQIMEGGELRFKMRK